MALNGLFCADVPLRNYSLTQDIIGSVRPYCQTSQALTVS